MEKKIKIDDGWKWRNDEKRFGFKILSKMGWKKGKGLGRNEDGNREHLKVKFKKDLKGVGWKPISGWKIAAAFSSDFNNLLSSLNESYCEENNSKGISQQSDISEVSLESCSEQFKNRLHYRKFIVGKDVSKYSEKDMQAIFLKASNKQPSSTSDERVQNSNERVQNSNERVQNSNERVQNSNERVQNSNIVESTITMTDYFSKKLQEKREKLLTSTPVNDEEKHEKNQNSDAIQENHTINKKKRKRKNNPDSNCSKKSKCDNTVVFLKGILKRNQCTEKSVRKQKEVSFSEDISYRIIENISNANQCLSDPEEEDKFLQSLLKGHDIKSMIEFEKSFYQRCKLPFMKLIRKANKKLRKNGMQDQEHFDDDDLTIAAEDVSESEEIFKKSLKKTKREAKLELLKQLSKINNHQNEPNNDIDEKIIKISKKSKIPNLDFEFLNSEGEPENYPTKGKTKEPLLKSLKENKNKKRKMKNESCTSDDLSGLCIASKSNPDCENTETTFIESDFECCNGERVHENGLTKGELEESLLKSSKQKKNKKLKIKIEDCLNDVSSVASKPDSASVELTLSESNLDDKIVHENNSIKKMEKSLQNSPKQKKNKIKRKKKNQDCLNIFSGLYVDSKLEIIQNGFIETISQDTLSKFTKLNSECINDNSVEEKYPTNQELKEPSQKSPKLKKSKELKLNEECLNNVVSSPCMDSKLEVIQNETTEAKLSDKISKKEKKKIKRLKELQNLNRLFHDCNSEDIKVSKEKISFDNFDNQKSKIKLINQENGTTSCKVLDSENNTSSQVLSRSNYATESSDTSSTKIDDKITEKAERLKQHQKLSPNNSNENVKKGSLNFEEQQFKLKLLNKSTKATSSYTVVGPSENNSTTFMLNICSDALESSGSDSDTPEKKIRTSSALKEATKLNRTEASTNTWVESQKQALKMSCYKNMYEKLKLHPVLGTSNLNQIKGYGNW